MNSSLPLVSVVIPLHNHAEFIASSVESCLAQTYPHVEIIIVDDCSTDESREVIRRYERQVRIVDMPGNVGACAARNAGLARATGQFVLFHDSDDILFPDKLRQDVDTMQHGPSTQIVVSANRWFTDEGDITCDPRPLARREKRFLRHMAFACRTIEQALVSILRYGGPQHSSVLYTTAFVADLRGYAEGTEPYSDRELLFRALCRHARIALNARVTCGWRMYESPRRMTCLMRGGDAEKRLMLATRYATTLEQAGLLDNRVVRHALIAHVAGRVYDYATRCQHVETARAALRLVAQLSAAGKASPREPVHVESLAS